MILTVTLNTALDTTYTVDALTPHAVHRVQVATTRAGGKGVNVARVLHALGRDVQATGLVGGAAGDSVEADLRVAGVPTAFVRIALETRRTVTVVDADATVFNEPGPRVAAAEWERFLAEYARLVAGARAVALSGSLPPGVPVDAYRTLADMAGGVPVVLDTAGEPLLLGLPGRPAVVKPNAAELREIAPGSVVDGARELLKRGAAAVVVSRGTDGLTLVTEDEVRQAPPPERVAGNPTGAGDAVVAALAAGLAAGVPLAEILADGVALGAAAVLAPLAGDIDEAAYRRFRASRMEEEACR